MSRRSSRAPRASRRVLRRNHRRGLYRSQLLERLVQTIHGRGSLPFVLLQPWTKLEPWEQVAALNFVTAEARDEISTVCQLQCEPHPGPLQPPEGMSHHTCAYLVGFLAPLISDEILTTDGCNAFLQRVSAAGHTDPRMEIWLRTVDRLSAMTWVRLADEHAALMSHLDVGPTALAPIGHQAGLNVFFWGDPRAPESPVHLVFTNRDALAHTVRTGIHEDFLAIVGSGRLDLSRLGMDHTDAMALAALAERDHFDATQRLYAFVDRQPGGMDAALDYLMESVAWGAVLSYGFAAEQTISDTATRTVITLTDYTVAHAMRDTERLRTGEDLDPIEIEDEDEDDAGDAWKRGSGHP